MSAKTTGQDGKPKISIIIPTYNSSECLPECLRSVASQTFRDFEVVVVDGGSKDKTVEVIRGFLDVLPRCLWISEKDFGVYDAMNKGVRLSSGDWLLFLGADDLLHDSSVLERIAAYLTTEYDFVYGNVAAIGNSSWARDGAIYDGEFSLEKIAQRNICHQAIFYSRQLFQRYGGYDMRYRVLADWAFNLKVFRSSRRKFVDVIIADFRAGGLSTAKTDDEFIECLPEVVGRLLDLPVRSSYYRSMLTPLVNVARHHWRRRRLVAAGRVLLIWLANADLKTVARQATQWIGFKRASA